LEAIDLNVINPPTESINALQYHPRRRSTRVLTNANTQVLLFNGLINGKDARILFDTGATNSFISSSFAEKHDLHKIPISGRIIHCTANGSEVVSTAKAMVTIQFKKYKKQVECLISDTGSFDCIMGMNWFMREQPIIKWDHPRAMVMKRDGTHSAIYDRIRRDTQLPNIPEISLLQFKRAVRKPETEIYIGFLFLRQDSKQTNRTTSTPFLVKKLLQQFHGIFAKKLPEELPPSRTIDHKIELIPDAKPPS
jgi:predicted aspartyl protease